MLNERVGRLAVPDDWTEYDAEREAPVKDPSTADVEPVEAELREGETAEQYVIRLELSAAKKQKAEAKREPVSMFQIRSTADETWIEQHAQRILAERQIERPTYVQARRAYVEAAALLARARRS